MLQLIPTFRVQATMPGSDEIELRVSANRLHALLATLLFNDAQRICALRESSGLEGDDAELPVLADADELPLRHTQPGSMERWYDLAVTLRRRVRPRDVQQSTVTLQIVRSKLEQQLEVLLDNNAVALVVRASPAAAHSRVR